MSKGETQSIDNTETGPVPDEIINAETQDAPSKTIAAQLDDGAANVHNFQGTKEETYRFVAACCGPDTIKSGESVGETIDIRFYFAHRVEMEGKGVGEFIDQIRIVLVAKDGKAYSFVSSGVVAAVDLIVSTFGNVPWETSLVHRIVRHQTRRGMQMISLVPA